MKKKKAKRDGLLLATWKAYQEPLVRTLKKQKVAPFLSGDKQWSNQRWTLSTFSGHNINHGPDHLGL